MPRRVLHVGPCRWSGIPLLAPGEERPPRKTSPVPHGQSSFEFFFQPILGSLSAYWWLDPPLFFGRPFDQELEDAWKIIEADGLAPPGTILPKLSRHILNDWCDVIGFLERPPATEVEEYRNSKRSVWDADLTFQNVDGAFWLMHSRNEQLFAAVEGYLRKIPEAVCFYEDLDSDG